MLVGVACGLAAGAFWGLTFVAPSAIAPYSELDLAILRYLAFGVTSLALMALSPRFRPGKLSFRQIRLALFLGLTGYVVYYVFVAFAVRLSGPAITPLVIGALPVLLALYGNWREPLVAWSAIVPALALIVTGLAVINGAAILSAPSASSRADAAFGFLLALCALSVWFLYAIVNARAMRAAHAPDALGWTSLQGIGAMLGVLPLMLIAPLAGWSEIPTRGFEGSDGARLLVWALVTGVLGSWLAQYFWTVASRRLPLALSAQMIVSETLFGLAYGFAFAGRWPHAGEWLGGALLIGGVMLGVRAFAARAGR